MIKLSEILTSTNIEALASYIKTAYNALAPSGVSLSDETARAIMILIDYRLNMLKSCYTIYATEASGLDTIKQYLSMYIFPLVTEIRNNISSLNKRIGSEHRYSKFNPIDNDDIDNAPVATDDESFSLADNMLTHINFLSSNVQTLNIIYDLIRNDCHTFIA